MKITRYNQNHIGGSIVKITSDNENAIVIDYGVNLDGSVSDDLPELSNVKAIFITHFHFDHIGLLKGNLNIPVYANKKAYESFIVYLNHMDLKLDIDFKFIEPEEEIRIDEFKVKAISCSHSAFQSMMYFIKVDDRTILHTGDFRLHGIDYNQLDCFKEMKDNLDILITEGTNITNDLEAKTEEDLKHEFMKLQDEYKYIYVLTSSTNYERIKTINDSVERGRYFITDRYQAEMIDSWGDRFELGFKNLSYGSNLDDKLEEHGFIMLIRPGENAKRVMNKFPKEKSVLVYSMWRGYIEMYPNLKKFMEGWDYKFIHTSGHVSKPDLERFINYLNPCDVMIIHTDSEASLYDLNIHAEIIDEKEMEFTWIYRDPKTSDFYNDVFELEKNNKNISVHYLQEKHHLSYEWANLLKNEILRYQDEEIYLGFLNKIDKLDLEIPTREVIAFECNVCYKFADELLNDYLDRKIS